MPTICKTWSCVACREKVLARVKDKISYGCSMVGRCFFITVTVKSQSGGQKDAVYVQAAWQALIRNLKQGYPSLTWFKVVEATKRGTPHLHLVMGGITPKDRVPCCTGKGADGKCIHPWTKKWALGPCRKDCLEHELAKVWYYITHDSWVIDCREVVGFKGAGSYMAKYFTKAALSYDVLANLGFTRRWSCSRNWPRRPKEQLMVTALGGWDGVEFVYSNGDSYVNDMGDELVIESEKSPLAKRVDNARYLEKREKAIKAKILKEVKRLANNRKARDAA